MAAILIKRTSEVITFDFDLSLALPAGETATTVISVAADQAGLTVSAPGVSATPTVYPDGVTAPAGQVIRCTIAGGLVPTGQTFQDYTVRAKYTTSAGNTREATVKLRIQDSI